MVSTACCDAPFSHPAPPVMEGWFCTLESTAAEPCSACLTRRALQGQYILSAPYCQLSPSQLRCREALQNLPKPSQLWPALPLGSLHFHTASALAFSAYSLLRFNLSSSSPLPRVCSPLPFYCDISLGNPKSWAKLPCPGGRPGIRPGLAAWRQPGVLPTSSPEHRRLEELPPSTGREQPALLCSSSCAERMAVL